MLRKRSTVVRRGVRIAPLIWQKRWYILAVVVVLRLVQVRFMPKSSTNSSLNDGVHMREISTDTSGRLSNSPRRLAKPESLDKELIVSEKRDRKIPSKDNKGESYSTTRYLRIPSTSYSYVSMVRSRRTSCSNQQAFVNI
jgi:hypothetical protein